MDQGKTTSACWLVLLLGVLGHATAIVREHHIAAVIADWDYKKLPNSRSDAVFKKILYREYEAGFQRAKTPSELSGVLGPTLRAEVGDKLKVNFKNMADKPLTMHPQGIAYDKMSEGSNYKDNTMLYEKMDDSVLPGHVYTYIWDITEDIGPKDADPFCLTYTYYSHENMVQDFNSGLIGPLLICKKGSLNDDGKQKNFDLDYVLMFAVFDESKSWRALQSQQQGSLMYTINGYINGTMPDFEACVGDSISWHFIGMSSKPELFSVHIFGQTMEQNQHKLSVLGLVASASSTANMTVSNTGKWLISSLVEKHVQAGMHSYINVESCSENYASVRKFTLYQKRYIKTWEYFIAAEETLWDYAKSAENNNRMHCHQKYKKAIYVQYTDNTFTHRVENSAEMGLLGPVIRAQVRDTITVVFKNMASKPYSIYPHGVSLAKSSEGASYPLDMKGKETQNQAVMPGETKTYYWNILETDEPTKNDPQCLTRMYHSAVNITRDIASGLIGPLLICKSMSLNTRGVQKKADLEQIAMFTVFDENKSWYQEDNKDKFCNMMSNKDETYPYNSNIIRTINGHAHENTLLGFCRDHVVQWHVSSVGSHDEIIGIHVTGHSFRYNGRSEDVINLFPMSGESISVEMDNVGVWQFGTLLFSKRNIGMKLRFRDVKCAAAEEDYDYPTFSFESMEIESKPVKEMYKESNENDVTNSVNDDMDYNEYLATLFHIRSLKNQTNENIEQLNFTALGIEDAQNTHFKDAQNTLFENNSVGIHNFEEFDDYSSNEILKDIESKTEEGKNIEPEIKTLAEIDLNTTAKDINVELNSKNILVNNTTEVYTTEPEILIRETVTENTREVNEDLNMTEIYDNEDSEMSQHIVDISYLYRCKPGLTNDTLEEIQPSVLPVNRSEDMLVKDVVKRDIEYVIENATSVPVEVDDYLGEETGSLNSMSNSTIVDKNNTNTFFHRSEISVLLSKIIHSIKQSPNGTLNPPTESSATTGPSHYRDNETQSVANYSNTTEKTMEDYEDTEFKEMFGSQVLEDIMKAISDHKQNNETETKENQYLEHEARSFEDIIHDENSTKNKDSAKRIKRPKPKPVANNTLSTGGGPLIRRRKKVVNKRPFQKDVPALNGSNQNNSMFEVNETLGSNKSEISGSGEAVFSPRGLKPQVIIGVPKISGRDYHEYDSEMTDDLDEEASYELVEYEKPYAAHTEDEIQRFTNPDEIAANYLRSTKGKKRNYYIAAEEVQWDYTGFKKSEKSSSDTKGILYTKVIFRQYLDYEFKKPVAVGEYEQHLGILGPVIRAEVDDVIQVTFKNMATRPYSLHAHGVSYEKSSEGRSYDDETLEWLKKDDAVIPGETHIYVWYATKQSGPEPEGSACRTWVYYSGVNPERDINSGLIGPLLICQNGTLDKYNNRPLDAREFILLFMTFEEDKSWYLDKNLKKTCTTSNEKKCHAYHTINGIIYNLPGLQMYRNELVRWHMLNMGGPKDIHVAHFHGQTFTVRNNVETQHGTYPLLPGSFATVEMRPTNVGWWLLDTEVAEYQEAGMQAMFHVINGECKLPMGLERGLITDNQITASHYSDFWEPKLARLNIKGSYNAWSTEMNMSALPWIQVDFERQVVISGIQTQGASKYMKSYYIKEFFIAYSKDKRKWTLFKGNSNSLQKLFDGNIDYSSIKENLIDPPVVARYIKLYATKYYNRPTLRMELLGCEIEGCFRPLGMENNIIKDDQITASSYKSSWWHSAWIPSFARLNKQGVVNAWQAKSNNNQQWLQIDFLQTKRISGIVTQGATSFPTEMFVKTYAIIYSENGKAWTPYTDGSNTLEFKGNINSKGHVKNVFNPPIISRYLRIVPKSWNQSITMRIEVFGCDI